MKTAISLPDDLFLQADRVAEQLNLNRSQLYQRALTEFLSRNDPARITDRLNEIYSQESSEIDPVIMQMQILSLPEDEW